MSTVCGWICDRPCVFRLQDVPPAVRPDGGDSGEGAGAVTLFQALLGLQPERPAVGG